MLSRLSCSIPRACKTENPNFYGCRTVLVPYCSSDLWVGNSTQGADGLAFRGRAIAMAVMRDLAARTFNPKPIPTPIGPGPSQTRLADADSITIVGGSGIVHLLTGADGGALASLVPAKPRRHLKVICDGCALADVSPRVSVADQPCTSAADCPPSTVLTTGLALWTSRPPAPSAAASLLADGLLAAVELPMLVQQPFYDATQLKQNRAWPTSPASAAYIRAFGSTMRATLAKRPHGGWNTFGVACGPTVPALLRDANGFFCRPVSCTLQGSNGTSHLRLAGVTSMFLRDPHFEPVCIDDCGELDCNAYCTKPSCWGADGV